MTMRRGRQSYNLSASEGPPQRPTANATISASRGRGPVCGAQIFVSNSYLRWLATRPVTQHSLFECLPPSDLPVLKSVSLDWAPATPHPPSCFPYLSCNNCNALLPVNRGFPTLSPHFRFVQYYMKHASGVAELPMAEV